MYAPSPGTSLPYLLFVCSVATLAGFLFGFDASVINGTVTALSAAFGTTTAATGLSVASVLLGSAVGSLLAGSFAERYGRKSLMLLTAGLFAIGAWGAGAANSAHIFIVFRLIGGLGVGAASVVAPTYIAEISPAHIRGRLATLQQVAIVLGLQSAFLSNFFIVRAAGSAESHWLLGLPAWRWMFWVQLIPSAVYLLAGVLLPESPRYLVGRGREPEARRIMERVWGRSVDLDAVLAQIRLTLEPGEGTRLRRLLRTGTRQLLPIVWIGIALAFFQQACGINAVIFFGELLWRAAGFSEQHALLLNVTLGSVLIVATLVSMSLVDRVGRRPLLLAGSAVMSAMLLVLAAVFIFGPRLPDGIFALSPTAARLALVAEHTFIFAYGASWGPVVWVLLGEMFTNRIRAPALGVGAGAQWTTSFIVAMSFPMLLQAIGLGWVFCLYAVAAAASYWTVSRHVPETRGRMLEEMSDQHPVRSFH